MFKEDAESLIPYFLPGATLLGVLDIEVLRAPMRVDRVYRVHYKRREYILHLELQSSRDDDLAHRTLIYNASLWRDYKLPVISLIVYLFEAQTVTSPLRQMGYDGEEILAFHFRVLKLWEYDAQQCMGEEQMQLYALLPAMQHTNMSLLLQAIDEMVKYYQGNETKLSQQLLWFKLFLQRTNLLSLEEKQQVEERLNMFEQLLEQDEWVQKQRALGEQIGLAKGKEIGLAKGKQIGKHQMLQENLLMMIEMRYPALAALAQKKVPAIQDSGLLRLVIKEVFDDAGETVVRFILESPTSK